MPVTIKTARMAYKDPTSGEYVGIDAMADPDLATKLESVAPNYADLTFPVEQGQHCYYEDILYSAKQPIPVSEEWTAAHWDHVVVGNELSNAKNRLSELESNMKDKAPIIVDSATGNPLSFVDGANNMSIENIIVDLLPKQDGSGDASPQNIRPFVLWTGCNIGLNAGNFLVPEYEEGGINPDTGEDTSSDDRYRSKVFSPIRGGISYYCAMPGSYKRVYFYDKDKTFISSNTTGTAAKPAPSNAKYAKVVVLKSATEHPETDCSLNWPYTSEDCISYAGQFSSIVFSSPIYGGTIDPVTGIMLVKYTMQVLNDADAWNEGDIYFSYTNHSYNDRKLGDSYNFYCTSFPTVQKSSGTAYIRWGGTTAGNVLIAPNDSGLTLADVKSMSSNGDIAIVYELDEPVSVQLNPIVIRSLFGNNIVWSDSNSSIEVIYHADTKLFCKKNDTVDDVQISGTSIVQNGIANIPKGTASTFGVLAVGNGLRVSGTEGKIITNYSGSAKVKGGTESYQPLVPYIQHESTFYGLAKVAGVDMASSNNAVGTYTDEAKQGIQKMFGLDDLIGPYESDAVADQPYAVGDPFVFNGKQYVATAVIALGDVIAPGTNCTPSRNDEVYVKKTDKPTASTPGAVSVDANWGIALRDAPNDQTLMLNRASYEEIKLGTQIRKPLVPGNQDYATFYGLAKAAGDATQSASDNELGNYTPQAKAAIRNMLDVTDKDTVTDKAPAIFDSVSGNPVSFVDGGDNIPFKDLTIALTPKQAGSGDPGPNNIRAISGWTSVDINQSGINIFDGELEKGALDNSGQDLTSNVNVRSKNYIPVVPGMQYYIKYTPTSAGASNIRIYFYYADKTYKSDGWAISGITTIPAEVYFVRFYMDTAYTAESSRDISFNYPPTYTDYYPYVDGIHQTVEFPATGKNLLINETLSVAGNQFFIGGPQTQYPIHLMPGTYTLSNAGESAYAYCKRSGETNSVTIHASNVSYGTFTVNIEGDYQIWLYLPNASASDFYNIQLERGNQATAYTPYTNVIYGGIVDLVNNAIKVTYGTYTFTENDSFTYSRTETVNNKERHNFNTSVIDGIPKNTSTITSLSNISGGNNWQLGRTADLLHYIGSPSNQIQLAVLSSLCEPNVESFKTWLASHPWQIVFELKEPYEIPLINPVTSQTLLGNNTVLTNGNGDISATYRADTKLFLKKNDTVDDVQLNGTSIVTNGIANIPIANNDTPGLIKAFGNDYGIGVISSGMSYVVSASDAQIKAGNAGSGSYRPIVPKNQSKAVFYGLAEASGDTTQSASNNNVGEYTDTAKEKIQKMIGLYTPKFYVKQYFSEETGSSSVPWISLGDTSLDIYEQLVVLIYQSDAEQDEVWSNTVQWNSIALQKTGSIGFSIGNYQNGSKPAIIKLKRFPSCYFMENITNNTMFTKVTPCASDVIESFSRIRPDPVSSSLKAGCTIEIYISRFY